MVSLTAKTYNLQISVNRSVIIVDIGSNCANKYGSSCFNFVSKFQVVRRNFYVFDFD